MVGPRSTLDQLISAFLRAELPFAEFQSRYSDAYIDDQADRNFSPKEVEYYGMVHERAEWVAPQPSPQEREDGWQDEAEFVEWLRGFFRSRGV